MSTLLTDRRVALAGAILGILAFALTFLITLSLLFAVFGFLLALALEGLALSIAAHVVASRNLRRRGSGAPPSAAKSPPGAAQPVSAGVPAGTGVPPRPDVPPDSGGAAAGGVAAAGGSDDSGPFRWATVRAIAQFGLIANAVLAAVLVVAIVVTGGWMYVLDGFYLY